MKSQFIIVTIVCLLLNGCVPPGSILQSRNILHIDAGLGVDGTTKIIQTDDEVDLLSKQTISLMNMQDFILSSSNVSWGLQPLTGHTQNLNFKRINSNSIRCYIKISKKEFSAEFLELEKNVNSRIYETTKEEKEIIEHVAHILIEFAKSNFEGRIIRVSKFHNPETVIKNK